MKKWELSRRAVLRGAGTAIALPFLEQMLPAIARAQGTRPLRRFFAFYVPNGAYMPDWSPAQVGAGYTPTACLKPLADAGLQNDVLVLSGLGNTAGNPRQGNPPGDGDHDTGTAAFLTCARPYKTLGADIKNGISVDQVMAASLRGVTAFPSLELGTQAGGNGGDCGSGYACVYMNNIAWSSATTALPKESNPVALFNRLFANFDPMAPTGGGVDAAAARRKAYKQSVIDAVKGDATALKAKLGRTDQRKMDEYLTSVRELELQVQKIGTTTPVTPSACTKGTAPANSQDLRVHAKALLDLAFVAFQCDRTRVVTFMMENGSSDYSYDFLGYPGSHHNDYSHQTVSNWRAGYAAIHGWHVSQLAYLLGKMKGSIDPDGNTMLFNSTVFFSSEVANVPGSGEDPQHNHLSMPVILGGNGGGAYSPGRHVRYTGGKFADLFIAALATMGVNQPTFGIDGTAPLANLK